MKGNESREPCALDALVLFNLDGSKRPVIGLEGRTCCYLYRVQTRDLAVPLSISQS